MSQDVEVCEVDGTEFDVAVEGRRCEVCGSLVCPFCVDVENDRCYPCTDAMEPGDA